MTSSSLAAALAASKTKNVSSGSGGKTRSTSMNDHDATITVKDQHPSNAAKQRKAASRHRKQCRSLRSQRYRLNGRYVG
jgi:hypothetical protein